MKLKFTKMQGIGNDFVIVEESDLKELKISHPELAVKVCDRRLGIGADGLIINVANAKETDFEWDFYNSDGSVAEMCGNGIRCFAKYLKENGFTDKDEFTVKTLAGVKTPKLNEDGTVTVNMGNPVFEPKQVPVVAQTTPVLGQKIQAKDKEFVFSAVSMGNPHCLIFVDDNAKELALEYGKDIEFSSIFPNKTNVEFIKVLSKNEINIDVWERGCGITQACGTGACASVVAAILNNFTDNEVAANLPGGQLKIRWDGSLSDLGQDVFMSGPAEFVFFGELLL
jgi:diaminopimelate epimerase